MAMKDFLKMFPMPQKTKVYTGLFENFSDREWSDIPNKCSHGVSYTKYEDAIDVHVSICLTLFDMFHGKCWYFAQYFKNINPDWEIVQILRGNFWNEIVHTFCIKKVNGITYFADARGITDDPEVFFEDYSCSKNAYIVHNNPELDSDYFNFSDACEQAYKYIFKDNKALII